MCYNPAVMANELQPQCVLGHEDCPTECPLVEQSADITRGLGDDFDPFMSRLSILFADASRDVNVVDVARVIGRCIKEGAAGSIDELNLSDS